MKVDIKELEVKVKSVLNAKYPDLLASVSITFKDEHGRHFTCTGFNLRKSKFNGKPYLVAPSKKVGAGFYKFNLVEQSLWKEIELVAVDKYDWDQIPIIEENTHK